MSRELELARAEIFRGRQRRLVFQELKERGQLVSEIMRKVNEKIKKNSEGTTLTLREVSRALKWLKENGYAVCINPPKEKGAKGILYKLSRKGKKVMDFYEG